MAVNPGYTRRKELRCTLAELSTYGATVLYEGEALYVLQKDGRYAVKFGDGKTPVADLPYSINYSEIEALKNAAANAQSLAEAAKAAAQKAASDANAAVDSLDIGLSVVDGELCITFEEET